MSTVPSLFLVFLPWSAGQPVWSVLLLYHGTLVQNIMVVYGIECVITVKEMVPTKSVSLFEFVRITDSEILSPDCTLNLINILIIY